MNTYKIRIQAWRIRNAKAIGVLLCDRSNYELLLKICKLKPTDDDLIQECIDELASIVRAKNIDSKVLWKKIQAVSSPIGFSADLRKYFESEV